MLQRRWTLDPGRLGLLKVELAAIELWDRHYYTSMQDKLSEDAFIARQKRRKELLDEILLIGTDAQAFRLTFGRFPC